MTIILRFTYQDAAVGQIEDRAIGKLHSRCFLDVKKKKALKIAVSCNIKTTLHVLFVVCDT